MIHAALFVFLATALSGAYAGGDWGYSGAHGPSHWADSYEFCDDQKQSPIDVDQSKVTVDTDLTPIVFDGYETPMEVKLENNGHTVQVSVLGEATVSGGELPSQYSLVQFHFHWGDKNDVGSEHTLNGKAYPMEMHFVHYNTAHASFDEALNKPEGLAVVGVFIEVGNVENQAFKTILDQASAIQFKDGTYSGLTMTVDDLLPKSRTNYYRYSGSLTTPACYESVVWTLLADTIQISQSQMSMFRTKFHQGSSASSDEMVNNYRPVQAINARDVLCSSEELHSGAGLPQHQAASLVIPLLIAAMVVAKLF